MGGSHNEGEEMELKTKRRQEMNSQENEEGISRQVDQKLILLQSSSADLMSTSDGFHREALQSKSLTFGGKYQSSGNLPIPRWHPDVYFYVRCWGQKKKTLGP